MGSQTIGIFCAYRERPNNDGKDPYELVGRTIGTFCTHRERPDSDGKGPHALVGRTIDIFYTHRERPDGSGKDQVVMGKGPLIFFTLIGKDQTVVGKTKQRQERPHALMGRTIDIFYTHRERPDGSGKDQAAMGKATCTYGKDH